jgi:hypothetical protein
MHELPQQDNTHDAIPGILTTFPRISLHECKERVLHSGRGNIQHSRLVHTDPRGDWAMNPDLHA